MARCLERLRTCEQADWRTDACQGFFLVLTVRDTIVAEAAP